MRLHTLELIKYGKFTDRVLSFPRAERDFHLIVGANEAGKSTIRRAISELLFGMPLRSEMGFVHPLAELRLGAQVESAAGRLAFHRARGRKSLRRPDDEALPDTALADHLGDTAQGLFERMFCLDLEGLLEGGRTILDASDDVGQLLFQSAAGIASLGAVRDALADEAGKLYAPRKSGERAFYQALDRHGEAKQALRTATVNTRQWSQANAQVATVEAAIGEAGRRYTTLAAERQKLERLRRIAPRVAQLRDAQAELQRLCDVTPFPADAAERLAEGDRALATQATALDLHRQALQSLQAQLDALTLDAAILALAPKVEALAANRQAYGHHARDIARCQAEIEALLRTAGQQAAQLGWPTDEAALRDQLPTPLALKTLATLMRERGALTQARDSADEHHRRAQALLERLQGRHTAQASAPPPDALRAALQAAQPFQHSATRQRTLQAAWQQAQAQLEQALAALAPWRLPPDTLATLVLPSEERLAELKAERAALAARADTARQQQAQAHEQARVSALALQQFAAGRHLVTLTEVQAARSARDVLWGRIKAHDAPLAQAAPQLDDAIAHADQLVDRQRDNATDSAQLLRLRQDSERDSAAEQARADEHGAAEQALAAFDARWADTATAAGLPGMPLADLSAWRAHRKAALDAHATAAAKAEELAAERDAAQAAAQRLHAALSSPSWSSATELGTLCASAEQLLHEYHASQAAATALVQQIGEAEHELAHQAQLLQQRATALQDWDTRWQAALGAARLDRAATPYEAASAAVELAEQVLATLAEIDTLRVQRLQAMEHDLRRFGDDTAALVHSLGIATASHDPFDTALALADRLHRARELQTEQQRLQREQQASTSAVRRAEATLADTRAALQSLYSLSQSDDNATVARLIADSDRRRACDTALQQHRHALLSDGDGLPLDTLLAEADSTPSDTLKPRLDELDRQLAESVDLRTRLAGDLTQAQAALQRVQGGADAAIAESKRLESLAQMGDAAERYMKVSAASRLLRWAIDRYRERKQGPLLQRAGELFARLTLGGFSRLVPDFEVTPPKLIAVRSTGDRVAIDGLSEGTRDQLFLSLRLAALELHIASERPLPFIADDLFVNFHDSRSRAGLAALGELSQRTQVVFLTHHEHLVEAARSAIGREINVVELTA